MAGNVRPRIPSLQVVDYRGLGRLLGVELVFLGRSDADLRVEQSDHAALVLADVAEEIGTAEAAFLVLKRERKPPQLVLAGETVAVWIYPKF